MGAGPTGVVVVGNKAYVTNQTANTLSIVTLNTTDGATVATFDPYPTPTVTASMAGKLYIAEGLGGLGRLSVFSETHGGWVGTIPLGRPATVIIASKGRIYAAGGGSLWVIDAAADIILTTLAGFTNPTAMTISQDRLFVTDSGKKFEIDLLTDQLIGSAPVVSAPLAANSPASLRPPFNGPGDIVHADGQLYIVNEAGNFLSIVSLDEGKVRNVPVGRTPKAVAVADGVAYVTNFGDNTLSVVTLAGLVPQVTTVTGVGDGPWGVGLIGQDIYVASHTNSKILRLRKSNGVFGVTVLTLSDVSKPRHLDTFGQKAYVACSGNNKLLIVDASPAAPTATSKDIAADPYDVKVASGKVYVTSSSSGKLTRRDLDGQNPKVQAGGTGPRGVDYSSTTSRIIVAAFGDNTVKQLDETYD